MGSTADELPTEEGNEITVLVTGFGYRVRLASGSGRGILNGGTIKLWDARSGECLQTLKDCGDINSVAFSPDSTRLASGSHDKAITLWDARSGECLQTWKAHNHGIGSVTFSPDSVLLASGSYDNTIKLWDARSGEYFQTLKGHSGWVYSVAFSPDSVWLASGSYDKTIKLWSVAKRSGSAIRTTST